MELMRRETDNYKKALVRCEPVFPHPFLFFCFGSEAK